VHTVHGWSFHPGLTPFRRTLYVALERLAARWSDALIVVSEADRRVGLELRIGRADQYELVRSGIDVARFAGAAAARQRVRGELGIPGDAFVFGSLARLSPQKAPLDLVDAFARLASRLPTAHLALVGDGPLREQVETRIADSALGSRVTRTGIRRDVPELLAAFDLLVLSSRWEGLPRVLPQAMASGVPIVATSTDGATEALEGGRHGVLVPPGDPHALAEAALALALDEDLRRAYAASGRVRALDFDEAASIERLFELYRRLLGASVGGA
jgi:glycosyltransferase involved in cell wall biosynthesis